MKVRVGGIIFDSESQPIMIVLEPHEKEDIKNMADSDTKYCAFPEEYAEETIRQFMDVT